MSYLERRIDHVRGIVITFSRAPSEQLRGIAEHIGDPSPPQDAITASTAGHQIVWTPDGRLIEIVR
jgi:hypothetical protein